MTMKEKKEGKEKVSRFSGEKKFYLITAIGCAAALIAIIVIAIAVTASNKVENPNELLGGSSSVEAPVDSAGENEGSGGNGEQGSVTPPDEDKPVGGETQGMVLPVDAVSIVNDYGFFHNKTLNTYYEHTGVDFSAAAGTEVKATESGKIESIYKDDILLGTEIVVDHGNGLKTVYRFINEREGLKVGDSVEKGEVIATVAEATGNEYKDGAHLHFEVLQEGKQVDPTTHLTLEEK